MPFGFGENTGMNMATEAGPLSYITGQGIIPQLLLTLVISTVLYITFMTFEMIYKSFNAIASSRVEVLPMTVSSETKPREFEQNPSARNAMLLPLSDNERTGAEFSYSFFLWINPSTFKQEDGLLHIMHKGNPSPFPLMGPGVFLKSNQNTLRVYMNSSKTWNNYIDIDNIPVKKWVHVVIMGRANAVEIYINGNIAKKLNLDGAVFYQNFGNLYLFNQRTLVLNPSTIPSLGNDILQIFGTYSGMMSNLYYYNYALSYTEIQGLTSAGPSKKTEPEVGEAPPYLEDSWWTSSHGK
jgi:hypothetical protein